MEEVKEHIEAGTIGSAIYNFAAKRMGRTAGKTGVMKIVKGTTATYLLNVHPDKTTHPHATKISQLLQPFLDDFTSTWE